MLYNISVILQKIDINHQAKMNIAQCILPAIIDNLTKYSHSHDNNIPGNISYYIGCLEGLEFLNKSNKGKKMMLPFYTKFERLLVKTLRYKPLEIKQSFLLFVEEYYKKYLPSRQNFISLIKNANENPLQLRNHLDEYFAKKKASPPS